MISITAVENELRAIVGFDDEQLEAYSNIIKNAARIAENQLKDNSFQEDSRIIHYAAAKANYEIALASSSSDSVTAFSAGDVSISENTDFVYRAKELFDCAKNDCADLILDNGFAFLGV